MSLKLKTPNVVSLYKIIFSVAIGNPTVALQA